MEEMRPDNPRKAPEALPKEAITDYKKAKDLILARAIAEGDEQAFNEIYERHHRRVYALCLRMLQNTHDAEDLTQEVFAQLNRKAGSFNGDSAFSTWLHRLTFNQVLMHLRKRSVKNEKVTDSDDDEKKFFHLTVAGTKDPNKMSIVDRIALNQAIDQLPKGYKDVFRLHDIEGFEHEEVARILGKSVGTSKSQLHKARLKLQKLLKKKANPKLAEPELSFKAEQSEFEIPKQEKKKTRKSDRPPKASKRPPKNKYKPEKAPKFDINNPLKDVKRIKFKDNENETQVFNLPRGVVAPPPKEFPEEILGVDLKRFRELRNRLPEYENQALQFIYEYEMYNEPERLAEILNCEVEDIGEIAKRARESFDKLKKIDEYLKTKPNF